MKEFLNVEPALCNEFSPQKITFNIALQFPRELERFSRLYNLIPTHSKSDGRYEIVHSFSGLFFIYDSKGQGVGFF